MSQATRKPRSTPRLKKTAVPASASEPPSSESPTPPVHDEDRWAEAFHALAKVISSAQSIPEAQKAQLAILQTLASPKACYMVELAQGRNELHVVSVRGRTDERITAAQPGVGPVGRAFSTGALVQDKNQVVIPLVGPQGIMGCMVLLEPKVPFSEPISRALGAQAAAAWEVMRLKDDSARRSKDLQTAIAGLKSLEKNRETLLSNVSHDLKNPLTTVKAYLSMLSQGKLGTLDEKQLHAIHVAERNADRLQKMVNDLLLISRLQSGKMQLDERPFGLKALMSDVMQTVTAMADQSKVKLELARSSEVFVKGDRDRLSEALHHLVEYAIHQSPQGGSVHLSISLTDGFACLCVQDSGPALSPEQLEHLFDSFHRVRTANGMRSADVGLDLPIVSKIAQLHGGRVEATRPVGTEGATFRLLLPAFAAALNIADVAIPSPRAGDILLVEDDKDCREVLQEVLESEGYSVMAAANVADAQSMLQHSRPVLVLLDLRLAHEDGRGVLHHIRQTSELKDTAVYLISGASEVGSLAAGTGPDRIDGFFEKPLQLQRLMDTVAAVVRPKRGQPQAV